MSEDLWMANQDTVLSGSDINFENMTLEGSVIMMVRTLIKRKIYLLKKNNIS